MVLAQDMACEGVDCAALLLLVLLLFAAVLVAVATLAAAAACLVLSTLSLVARDGGMSGIPRRTSFALLTTSVLCYLCIPVVVHGLVSVGLAAIGAFWPTLIIYLIAWIRAERTGRAVTALTPSPTPQLFVRNPESERPRREREPVPTPEIVPRIKVVPLRRVPVYATLLAISLVGLVLSTDWTVVPKLITSEGIVTTAAVAAWWLTRPAGRPTAERELPTGSCKG